MLKLKESQDITALALNKDNTNLLVSTVDKQFLVFTDPAVSTIFPFCYTSQKICQRAVSETN